MTRLTPFTLAVCLLSAPAGAKPDPRPTGVTMHSMTQAQKNVLAAVEQMTDAFHRGDIDGVMAAYTPTATVVFDPKQPTTTRADIRARFEAFTQLKPQFRYSGHEVFIAGDTAVHIAPWRMTGTAPDGTPMSDQGLSVAILKRQADGRWLMVIDDPYGQHLIDARGYPH